MPNTPSQNSLAGDIGVQPPEGVSTAMTAVNEIYLEIVPEEALRLRVGQETIAFTALEAARS
jgi:hypothetical protein